MVRKILLGFILFSIAFFEVYAQHDFWAGAQFGTFEAKKASGVAFDADHECYGGGYEVASKANWALGRVIR